MLQGREPLLKKRANLGRGIGKSQEKSKQIQRGATLFEHFKQAVGGSLRPAIYNVPDASLELQAALAFPPDDQLELKAQLELRLTF